MNDITRVLIKLALIVIPFCVGFYISKIRINRKYRKTNRNRRTYSESAIRNAISNANATVGSVTFAGEFESMLDGYAGEIKHPNDKSDTSDVIHVKPMAKIMTVQRDNWFKRLIRRRRKKKHISEFEMIIQAMESPNTVKLHEGSLTSDSITAIIKFDKEN